MALSKKLQRIHKKHHRKVSLSDLQYGFRTIRTHLKRNTPGYTRDLALDHLKKALQGAVSLEFSTLPPYLSALWSVKDDLSPVAKSIREIAQEEMLHMALACNMLSAIGGQPYINSAVPIYPGKLPLKVHPELTVELSGLSRESLLIFLEIERPEHPDHYASLQAPEDPEKDLEGAGQKSRKPDLTIGELYGQILDSFQTLQPRLSTDRQITGPLAWMVVTNLDEVAKAIYIIKDQGEGSEGPPRLDDLDHYHRFAELYEGKRLVYNEELHKYEYTTPIVFNMAKDVWKIAPVPKGGYTDDIVSDPEVRRLLRCFNVTYSNLIDLLQSLWENDGGEASLWNGISTMFEMEKYSRPLMEIPRPDGAGNYGPDFRYIPKRAR